MTDIAPETTSVETTFVETMRGSYGTISYFVLARRGDVAIGFRPLVGLSANGKAVLGGRLRVARFPSDDAGQVTSEQIVDAFPSIPWQTRNSVRQSLVVGLLTALPSHRFDLLPSTFDTQRFTSKLIGYLVSNGVKGDEFVVEADILAEALRNFFIENCPPAEGQSENEIYQAIKVDDELGPQFNALVDAYKLANPPEANPYTEDTGSDIATLSELEGVDPQFNFEDEDGESYTTEDDGDEDF